MAATTQEKSNDAANVNASQTIQAPTLSLPKGGGAISGIGEKFNTNPITGSGVFNVPLPVSPARSGFTPQLSLSYDSGSGNGSFGMGFSLSLAAITRRTDKGLPRYLDVEESDVFIHSGNEDLVLLEGSETLRDGYRIVRYRPRIEGGFARIERWCRLADGDIHWRSISKNNVLSIFGLDANSRIADPDQPSHIFSWLLCQSYDDKGNAIQYQYVAEDAHGVNLQLASEKHRARGAQRYLKRVLYGNRKPVCVDTTRPDCRPSQLPQQELVRAEWLFELLFDYGERHVQQQANSEYLHFDALGTQNWSVRRDPFSNYRAGFEVRTYRLCQRVLMLHHFDDELGGAACLVKSTNFDYQEKPQGSFIQRIVQNGHQRSAAQQYNVRSWPALELAYTSSPLEDEAQTFPIHTVAQASLAHLPGGMDGNLFRWLDMHGEGIPGLLSEQGDAWWYQANLGEGRFAAPSALPSRPSLANLNGGQVLTNVAGSGQLELLELAPGVGGFYGRQQDSSWANFRAFSSLPNRDWKDANLRFVDLTGDGSADILLTEDDALVWHPALLTQGFGAALRLRCPPNENEGPRVLFADAAQSIYLADMSGDGLSDILRIRNGEICYWPNLGYGRFGAKVSMDHAPRFDLPDQFNQARIRLADTDGTGTTDIVYLHKDGVRIYLNQMGAGWSKAYLVRHFPPIDDLTSVSVADFLGRGTACLVWSSANERETGRQIRYIDLMQGQKPHLLVRSWNNLGAETRIEYASSTEFYLADQAAGTPWLTRLPFPVHVVKRVESYDYISRNRFSSSYSYHHGFYDAQEREFRGFARVDQQDSEAFASLSQSGHFPVGENIQASSHLPPVLTKTWYHTGVYLSGASISLHMAQEYYQEEQTQNGEALLLDDTVLPAKLSAAEAREACRSLKGALLRQEVYALDGTAQQDLPYAVTENNYTIKVLQRQGKQRHAVFLTHARETLQCGYERMLYATPEGSRADPRIAHTLTLAVDDYGNVLQAVAVAYGRRLPEASPLLTTADHALQARCLVTLSENSMTNAVQQENAYRAPAAASAKLHELHGIQFEPGKLLAWQAAQEMVASLQDAQYELPCTDWQANTLPPGGIARRLLSSKRSVYRSNDLQTLLPLGQLQTLALPGESYALALTPEILTEVYQHQQTQLLVAASDILASRSADGGGYLELDGDGRWWTPSGRVFFHPDADIDSATELAYAQNHFFLAQRFLDQFGNSSSLYLDKHDLLPVRVVDTLGNTVSAINDYRVLQPRLVTDANGNRSEALFDTLGLLVANAVMGKDGENLGDSLQGITADLSLAELDAFFADPQAATDLLGAATLRVIYDIHRYARTSGVADAWQPAFAATLTRETHVSDLAQGQTSRYQISIHYSDGFGRQVQSKILAEAGLINDTHLAARWIGTGWTIFNNKGKPVRQYEPYFDDSHAFRFAHKIGVSPILFYDPLGRVVAALNPNHTWQKMLFDPWRQESWDVNDTALIAPPDDAHVGAYLRALPESAYLPTWHQARISGALGAAEQAAAKKTEVHATTPTVSYVDALGRPFLALAHNRYQRLNSNHSAEPEQPALAEFYSNRTLLDISGQQRAVFDAKDRMVMRFDYDLQGQQLHQASMDAGERWVLPDVTGKPVRSWDSRTQQVRHEYDRLRRPSASWLKPLAQEAREYQTERLVYGEQQDDAQEKNLRGQVFQLFDQAGIVTNTRYDFKGNLLHSFRQLAREYKTTLDWSASLALETSLYVLQSRFDALNRPIELISPDLSRIRPIFNQRGLLLSIQGHLHSAPESSTFVREIGYDAKGQRSHIVYGNGVHTQYSYDPLSFRLTQLQTRRPAEFAEDCPPVGLTNWPGCQVQNLFYTYDPIGNISHIRDAAQQAVYFRNRYVDASNDYTYDALYRLLLASGREQLGQQGETLPHSADDALRCALPQPGVGNALGRYSEHYVYDAIGNLLAMQHRGSTATQAGWKRSYQYTEPSQLEAGKFNNRLSSTQVGELQERYHYEGKAGQYGNITAMPHLPLMQWDYRDQLQASARQVLREGTPETTWYVYDASGQRLRKITERQTALGVTPTRRKERIYLGGFEIYREFENDGETIALERESLHILDGKQRIALIETRTKGADTAPQQLSRYQLSNHLGSSSLELDEQAQIISYEEFTPYGSSSYQAVRSQTETPKRYRYTGKERDEENGFSYHGARYYAPWLGRWISADPIGIKAGLNVYAYVHGNPIKLLDSTGTDDEDALVCSTVSANTAMYSSIPPNASFAPANTVQQISIPAVMLPSDNVLVRATGHPVPVEEGGAVATHVYVDPDPLVNGMHPTNPLRSATPAEHALGMLGRPVTEVEGGVTYSYVLQDSPYLATSSNIELACFGDGKGAYDFQGEKYLIDVDKLPASTQVVSNSEVIQSIKDEAAITPSLGPRADIYIANQAREQENLLKGSVPPEALTNVEDARVTLTAEVEVAPSATARFLGSAAEAGIGVLKFAGRALTVYGAHTMAARNASDFSRYPTQEALVYGGTFLWCVGAGVVDDAFGAAETSVAGAPVTVFDSWERNGAGPVQVEVANALRAFYRWDAGIPQ